MDKEPKNKRLFWILPIALSTFFVGYQIKNSIDDRKEKVRNQLISEVEKLPIGISQQCPEIDKKIPTETSALIKEVMKKKEKKYSPAYKKTHSLEKGVKKYSGKNGEKEYLHNFGPQACIPSTEKFFEKMNTILKKMSMEK